MGSPISLFSGYSNSENRTTNYCLLILKMIYDESPDYLAEVLSTIFETNVSDDVGVKFSQQIRKTSSVPDGLITQKSFAIYIETKNFDWFYDKQIEEHLKSLNKERADTKYLIALSNFENTDLSKFDRINNLINDEYQNNIVFKVLSFEDFYNSLQALENVSKNFKDKLFDFEQYLNEENLLPKWKYLLDVVNCANTTDEFVNKQIYMCPATGGSYSHSRSKYLGMYKNKKVSKIAEIKAVVDVISLDYENTHLLWNNTGVNGNDSEFKKEAIEIVKKTRPGDCPLRVFLLGTPFDTDFIKDSKGGMMGSKQYFDLNKIKDFESDKTSISDLASMLNNLVWSDF